jgi:hypothetical protein
MPSDRDALLIRLDERVVALGNTFAQRFDALLEEIRADNRNNKAKHEALETGLGQIKDELAIRRGRDQVINWVIGFLATIIGGIAIAGAGKLFGWG